MLQLKVDKFGKNKVGMWCLGLVFDDKKDISYSGLVNLDKEYVITENETYTIQSLKLRTDKKGILRITIAL